MKNARIKRFRGPARVRERMLALLTMPNHRLLRLAPPWSLVHYGRRREFVQQLERSPEHVAAAAEALGAACAWLAVSPPPSLDRIDSEQLQYWSLVSQTIAAELPTFLTVLTTDVQAVIESQGCAGRGSAEAMADYFRRWAVEDLAEEAADWLVGALPSGEETQRRAALDLVAAAFARVSECVALRLVPLVRAAGGGAAELERLASVRDLSTDLQKAIEHERSFLG